MKILLCAILAVVTASRVFPADWPQFKRSPNRQGCSLGESITLPSKLCAWVDFGAPIQASPAVVAGKAYAMAGNGLLACVDLATNTVVWHAHLGGGGNESSPAIGGGKVYVGSTSGVFYVLNSATGAILKQYAAGAAILAAPLLLSSGVYFGGADGKFHALDLDGNLKWTYTAKNYIVYGAASESGKILFTDGNNLLYCVRDLGASCAVDYSNHSAPGVVISTPMIWNSSVFLGGGNQEYTSGSHQLARFDLATGAFSAVLGDICEVRTAISVDTATSFIFAGSNSAGLFARNMGSGSYGSNWATISQWYDTTGIYGVSSSPAVISNCVIFGSEQGEVHFFQKDNIQWPHQDLGVQLWSYKTASRKGIDASPAVSDGRVVVGSTDGCLYGFWNGTQITMPVKVDSGGSGVAGAALKVPGGWTFSVFPNPAGTGKVTLISQGPLAGISAAIYDVSGSLLARIQGAGNSLDWDLRDNRGRALPAGSYPVILSDGRGKQVRTFNLRIIK